MPVKEVLSAKKMISEELNIGKTGFKYYFDKVRSGFRKSVRHESIGN